MAFRRLHAFLFLIAAALVHAASPGPIQAHDAAALLERQAPGTPQFDCHSNCGNALAGGRAEGHCTNETWVGYYEACLKCALEFDIWKHYSTGVTGVAKPCGLTPTPSPAASGSGSASSSASGSLAPTPTAPPASTSTPPTAAASITSTAGAPIATLVPASVLGSGALIAGLLALIAAV